MHSKDEPISFSQKTFVIFETESTGSGHESLNLGLAIELAQFQPMAKVEFLARRSHIKNLKRLLVDIPVNPPNLNLKRLGLWSCLPRRKWARLFIEHGSKRQMRRASKPSTSNNFSQVIVLSADRTVLNGLLRERVTSQKVWVVLHGSIETWFEVPRDQIVVRSLVGKDPAMEPVAEDGGIAVVLREMSLALKLPYLRVATAKSFKKLVSQVMGRGSDIASDRQFLRSLCDSGVRLISLSAHTQSSFRRIFPELIDSIDFLDMPCVDRFLCSGEPRVYNKASMFLREDSGKSPVAIGLVGSASSVELMECFPGISDLVTQKRITLVALSQGSLRTAVRTEIDCVTYSRRLTRSEIQSQVAKCDLLLWPRRGGYELCCSLSFVEALYFNRSVVCFSSTMSRFFRDKWNAPIVEIRSEGQLVQLVREIADGKSLFPESDLDKPKTLLSDDLRRNEYEFFL